MAAELLEEVRHPCRCALVAQRAEPVWIAWPGPRAAFAAGDDPMDSAPGWRTGAAAGSEPGHQVDRAQQRLGADEPGDGPGLVQPPHPVDVVLVLDADAEP